MSENIPLHPVALNILGRIEAHDEGAKSAMSRRDFASAERLLAANREEKGIFVHLVVLHARLKRSGLTIAAAQLIALARIGLEQNELDRTLESVDQFREAARNLRAPVTTRTNKGLARGSSAGGVGLRRPTGTIGSKKKL